MNNVLKVTKYQLRDFVRSIIIFYTIFLSISLFMKITMTANNNRGNVHFGGFGIAALIYIFIAGLNCFRSNFMFMQANNVSRKRFYYANIITLIIVAAFMALIDVIMNNILNLFVPYNGVFEQLYRKDFFFADFTWSFALFAFAASLGWVITMIYYKSGKVMKTVISVMPIFIIMIISVIDNQINGVIGKAIVKFLGTALGFYDNFNSYMAVLSFSIGTAALFALSYLLIRRAAIKN